MTTIVIHARQTVTVIVPGEAEEVSGLDYTIEFTL